MQTIEAGFQGFMKQYSEQQTEDAKAIVVRNGYLPKRELQTSLGPVTIKVPFDKRGRPFVGFSKITTHPLSSHQIGAKTHSITQIQPARRP